MGNNNFLKINDTVQFSLLAPDLMRIKDDYEGAFRALSPTQQTHHTGMGTVTVGQPDAQQQSNQQGLLVRIAATHAGIITRNNGFYLPDKMRVGANTFISNFPKPILLHHDDEADPIGRVADVGYIDTSGAIADQYDGLIVKNKEGKEIGTITNTLIKDFVSDKMPFGQQIDVVRSLLQDSILADQGYEGLGHIQLVANITDPAAIQKLLDGRYLTGSTGASTDAAICSVCRSDWTENGRCEHTPGAVYDGAKCFIIAGKLSYDEFSFVNKPADRHAKVLELHYNGIQDSVQIAEDSKNRLYEINLEFPQYETKDKENTMGQKDADTNTPTATDPNPELVIQDNVQDSDKGPINVADNTIEPETVDTEVQDDTVDNSATVEGTQEESVDEFVARVLDSEEKLSDEDEEKLYDIMWQEILAAIQDGELEIEAELLEDAKLSSEKRKKLPKSTFCGPNKSFPVPDCAHVTAARRLIGRYKGPGDKSSILACVARKAKALGCPSAKPKDNTENTQDNVELDNVLNKVLEILNSSSLEPLDNLVLKDNEKTLLQNSLKCIANLVGKDAFVQCLYNEELAHDEQALLDEVAKNEETIGDLRESLEAVRKEYHLLFEDMTAIQDALVNEKSKTRKEREDYLTTLVALRDNTVKDQDFGSLSDSDLDSEISRTLETIDMVKIVDKLGDGMSRVPTEQIDDPVEVQDSVQKRNISVAALQNIEERYWTIRLRDGARAAESFLQKMKAEGLLPQDNE